MINFYHSLLAETASKRILPPTDAPLARRHSATTIILLIGCAFLGACEHENPMISGPQYMVDATSIVENPKEFCWSGDGKNLFVPTESEIYAFSAENGVAHKIASGLIFPEQLQVSTDGEYLFIDVRADPTYYWSEHFLLRMPADGSFAADTLFRWGNIHTSYTVAPSGSFMVYSKYPNFVLEGKDSSFLWSFVDDKEYFIGTGSVVAISQDESKILINSFSAGANGGSPWEIITVEDRSTRAIIAPVPETENVIGWQWLPNGLCAIVRDYPIRLYVFYNLDARLRRPLTSIPIGRVRSLDWSGSMLAWWESDNDETTARLSWLDPETLERNEIMAISLQSNQTAWSDQAMKISPDGKSVAFMLYGILYVKGIDE